MHNLLKSLKVKALMDKIPGWCVVGGVTLSTAIWGALQSQSSDLLKDATSGQFSLIWPIVWHALAVGLVAEAAYLKTDPWTPVAPEKPQGGAGLPGIMGGIFGALMLMLVGCQQLQAAAPELTKIENVVLADVEANDSNAQIVSDVAKTLGQDLGAGPAVVAFVTAATYDAMQFLIDMGVIPAKFLDQAKAQAAALKILAGK